MGCVYCLVGVEAWGFGLEYMAALLVVLLLVVVHLGIGIDEPKLFASHTHVVLIRLQKLMLFLPIHQRQIIKNIFIKPRRNCRRPNSTLQQRSKSIFFLDILTIFTFDNVETSLDFLDIIFEGTVVVAYVVF